MISVERLQNLDSIEYDKFVEQSPFSSIYQTYDWGEIKRSEGWDVVRLLAREDGAMIGSLSCLIKKVPAIGYEFYYCPRGPVVDYTAENGPEVFRALVTYVRSSVLGKRAVFFRVSPDLEWRPDNEQLFVAGGFRRAANPVLHTTTMRLDLRQSEEQLLGAMEGRTRYDIRRAMKEGIRIQGDDGDDGFLQIFYRLLSNTSRRNRFPIYSYELMKTIWDRMRPKNRCRIFLSRLGEEVLSGVFLFVFGGKCIYQWGASDHQKLKVNPNQLLHWEVIQAAKTTGCISYDFQGIPEDISPDHPLWGIYLFKRGFGPTTVKLVGEYDLVTAKSVYSLWNTIEPVYPKLKHKLSWIGRL